MRIGGVAVKKQVKSWGIEFKLNKFLCFFLSVCMIIMGLPLNSLAAEPASGAIVDPVPAKVVFDTEFVPTDTTYYKPHQLIKLKARAYNKDGVEVPCNMKYKAFNPMGDKIIADGAPGGSEMIGRYIDNNGSEYAVSQVDLGSGNARVEAYCEEKPDVKDRQQINSKGEFLTAEEWQAEENMIKEMQAQGSFANYSPPVPLPPAGSTLAPAAAAADAGAGAAGGGISTGAILLGAGAAVGVLGIVALAAVEDAGSQCSAGYAPCGSYDVCCPDLRYYCPSNGGCYSLLNSGSCPGSVVQCRN